jgi:hypothetical protein
VANVTKYHRVGVRTALLAATALAFGALAATNPITAAAAPGDSSGDTSSQPIPMVPIGPIQGEAPPQDLKVRAAEKPPSAIPPGTVLNEQALTPPPPKGPLKTFCTDTDNGATRRCTFAYAPPPGWTPEPGSQPAAEHWDSVFNPTRG